MMITRKGSREQASANSITGHNGGVARLRYFYQTKIMNMGGDVKRYMNIRGNGLP
jgi:hypothetical protein